MTKTDLHGLDDKGHEVLVNRNIRHGIASLIISPTYFLSKGILYDSTKRTYINLAVALLMTHLYFPFLVRKLLIVGFTVPHTGQS